ncbi:MAG: TetR/AcrR family transcriptional regulator [Acidobacteriota bacterium]
MTLSDSSKRGDPWNDAIRDARRARIIEAAAAVFSERGLDGASVRNIAAAAGCTTGAIYPLFKNKEEIYAALLSRSLDELHERMMAAAREAATPADRVRAQARCILDFYLERPPEFALSFYLSAGLKRKGVGELNTVLNDKLATLKDLIEAELTEVVGTDQAPVVAAGLFGQIVGLLLMELRGRFNVFASNPHDLLERCLAMTLSDPHPARS